MFGQTFELNDLLVVGLLVVLEGVLSIDNALVLGLLARRLPKRSQGKALTYGLIGALVFRLVAVCLAAYLLKWSIVKVLGGAYLIYVALKHFFGKPHASHLSERAGHAASGFWSTVLVIEVTDIAFAVDSILAAIALVGPAPAEDRIHPKLWVVLVGGMLGVVLMRAAAVVFIKLLEKFPRFETSAYLLVLIIGAKLLVDWAANSPKHHRVNFQDVHDPAFWVFWAVMLGCFGIGFVPGKGRIAAKDAQNLAHDPHPASPSKAEE